MTDKQKAAFLRSEGWKIHVHSGFWWDPVKRSGNPLNISIAYQIASRRKAAREVRRLKAAGMEFVGGKWWGLNPFKMGEETHWSHVDYESRAEALATLTQEGR